MFKHKGQYYLKKIQKKELTIQQVADILNVSFDTVNTAYFAYIEEHNPFKKKSFEYKSAIIQIMISVISTMIVLFTLFEMQEERNATYLPDISLSKTEVAMIWNKEKILAIDKDYEDTITKMAEENTVVNRLPQMKIYNLGVGAAKNISFHWENDKNVRQFQKVLNNCDDVEVSCIQDLVVIKRPGMESESWILGDEHIDFLLNSTKEYDTLFFPQYYYDLIQEIYLRTDGNQVPPLYLSMSFQDVQGKVYTREIKVCANISFKYIDSDGSGCCIFDLKVQ